MFYLLYSETILPSITRDGHVIFPVCYIYTLPGDTSEEPPVINPDTGLVEARSEKTTPAKMSPFKHSPLRNAMFRKPATPVEVDTDVSYTHGSLQPAAEGRVSAKTNLLSELTAEDENKENTPAVTTTAVAVGALDVSDTSDLTPSTDAGLCDTFFSTRYLVIISTSYAA